MVRQPFSAPALLVFSLASRAFGQDRSCIAHPGCVGLAGACCPTDAGLMLGCCGQMPPPPSPVLPPGGDTAWQQQQQQRWGQAPGPPQQPWGQAPAPPTWPESWPDQDIKVDDPQDYTGRNAENAEQSWRPWWASSAAGSEEDLQAHLDAFKNLTKFVKYMQPIYLLPVSNGMKQLFTFYVFGFDLKFKPKDGTATSKKISFALSSLFRLIFIFLAINAYKHDYNRFAERSPLHQRGVGAVCALLLVWCTSPNFAAGLGLWGQFRVQSPAVVFWQDVVNTNYCACRLPQWLPLLPYSEILFPALPGGARWLSLAKQVYAIILLPYVLPAILWHFLMGFISCFWLIVKDKCLCICSCVKLHLNICVFGFLFIISAGNYHYARERLQGIWGMFFPFFYMYMVYVFASFVVPIAVAALYGILQCIDPRQVWKGIGFCRETHGRNRDRMLTRLDQFVGDMQDDPELPESRKKCWRDCQDCYICVSGWYFYFVSRRELELEDADRELLIRVDRSRLTKDFVFRMQDEMDRGFDGIQIRREALMTRVGRVQQRVKSFSSGSSSDDDDSDRRSLLDILVGEENLRDGDVDLDNDSDLEEDLKNNQGDFCLDDAQVQIVMLTVKYIAEVAILQALTIFFIRMSSANSFDGLVQAMDLTISERHIDVYLSHLARVGEESISKALNAVWSL